MATTATVDQLARELERERKFALAALLRQIWR